MERVWAHDLHPSSTPTQSRRIAQHTRLRSQHPNRASVRGAFLRSQVAMWLFETDGNVFEGRRLWLRPGKRYLFGRTDSEPGQLAISHKTISRKHLTIEVDNVSDGDSQHLSRRSTVTIEDLGTKTGTTVDGHKYKGEKHVVAAASAEIKMGGCPDMFRLTWQPVALTFSFSSREMQSDPFSRLRVDLEQLDVKLLADYNIQHTTHVVTKKRNTSKGLQALINGRYIVADSFVDAIVAAATPPEDDDMTASSALETDFDGNWPDPLKHLPPRGGEPVERPPSAYAPDEARLEIFEGYTFIFYDKGQFDNLLAPITNGKGKALYTKVDPRSTTVDDFVLYVKTEAGEKGLGSFDDGSEGRGVVVVRFVPNKGDAVDWYADFFTQVSLRLDHRPIEQNEFLEAILIKDASILRRPLEMDPTQGPASTAPQEEGARVDSNSMDIDQPTTSQNTLQESAPAPKPATRSRVRRAPTRRFAGFDADDDDDDAFTPPVAESKSVDAEPEDEGLFVSQDAHASNDVAESSPDTNRRSQRKRPAAQDDDIEDIIPTAAAVKRRRIAAGEEPVPRNEPPEPAEPEPKPAPKVKKVKKEIDVLDVARQQREAMEARLKAEKEDLANLPDDVDLEQIRRLHIVEEMPLRQPPANRSHDKDDENGRWDPRWNGRKNFKRFKPRGELTGRPPQKVIVSLTQVKPKEFGIGDDYWLEDDSQRKKKGNESQKSGAAQDEPAPPPPPPPASRPASRQQRVVLSDDSEEDDDIPDTQAEPAPAPEPESEPEPTPASRSRSTRTTTTTQSQNTTQSQSTRQTRGKRAAPEPAKEPPAKKPRATRKVIEVADSDDSEDELKFKFGRRR
ncbi:FHA domain-containing protein [Colletotrichum simmondsii]|uniref:FHA domain-containing protein n=1 Tax=Colletotrichum simmondsii TaxID=703756 RepID=A0A135RMP5_9PEZI|nr:FHA domain-containing protein [Colletotrichum simmondsii]